MAADLQQSEILQKHIEEPVNDEQLPENGKDGTGPMTENDLGNNVMPNEDKNKAVNLNETPADEGSETGMDFQDDIGNIGDVEDKSANKCENGLNGIEESSFADAVEEKSGSSTVKSETATETTDNQLLSNEVVSETLNHKGIEHNKISGMKDGDMLEEAVNHLDTDKESGRINDENMIQEDNNSDDKLNEVVTFRDSQNDSSDAPIEIQSFGLSPVGVEDERPSSAAHEEEEEQQQEIENEETELELDNEELEMISEEVTEKEKHEKGSLVENVVDDKISLDDDAAQDLNNMSEKLSEVTSEEPQDDSGNPEYSMKESDDTGKSSLERSPVENVLDSNRFNKETGEDLTNALEIEEPESNSRSCLTEEEREDNIESVNKELNITQVNLVEDQNKGSAYNEEFESFITGGNAEVDPSNDIEKNEFIEENSVYVGDKSEQDILEDSQEKEIVEDNDAKQESDNAATDAATDTLEDDNVVNDVEVDVLEDNRIGESESGEKSPDILYEKMDTDQKLDTNQLDSSLTDVITEPDKDSNEVDMVSEGINQNMSEGLSNDVAIDGEDANCGVYPQHYSADKENLDNQEIMDVSATNQESETSVKEQPVADANQGAGTVYEEHPLPGTGQETKTIKKDQETETSKKEQPVTDNNEEMETSHEEQPVPGSDQETGTNDIEQSLPGSDQGTTSKKEEPVPGNYEEMGTSHEEQLIPDTGQEMETNHEEQSLPGSNKEMGTIDMEQSIPGTDQERATIQKDQPLPGNDQEMGTNHQGQPLPDTDLTGTSHEEQPLPSSDKEMGTSDIEHIPGTDQDKETKQEEQPLDCTSITGSELETVVFKTVKATDESESPMEADEDEGHDKSLCAAEDKDNQDSEAMEIIEDSSSVVKASVDAETEKLKESVSTVDGQNTTIPNVDAQSTTVPSVDAQSSTVASVDEQNTTVPNVDAQNTTAPNVDAQSTTVPSALQQATAAVEGSQIKEETDDDVLELKIVGVTSAVGKEEETRVKPQDVALKIDSVQGADQTKPKTEEVISKDSKAEDTNPVAVKTESKMETTKSEKEIQSGNVMKKEDDDDVIAVKEEKKPPPPPKPKTSKIQKCIVCSKVGKCKYNIVRNGDVKHLCDDTCFKEFRSNPTAFLKQAENDKNKAESAPKNGTQPTTAAVTNKPDTQQSAVNKMQQGTPYKTCTVCQLMNLKSSKPFLSWQGLDYCGEDCLGKFQGNLSITCGYCSSQIHQSNKAKFCCRVGEEVKHFCSRTCSSEFVKRMKACAFCNKDLAKSNDSFMAPVGNQGMFKDFCSQSCLVKYEDINGKETEASGDLGQGSKTATVPKGNFACSVCSKVGPVKHEVKLDNKVHQLCSDPCFSAFQYANKLTRNGCDNCGTSCFNDSQAPHYIQFEGKQKRFCSFMCVNSFRNQKKKPTPCAWCGTKKSNFDMIERVDSNNKFQLFCSLNCLSLYRVNLQATSNQAIVCDQCSKFVPAQYHLTMSDASVRNFCSYGCVMQFQAQFQTPANQKTPNVPSKQTQSTSTQQQVTTTRSGRVVTRGTKQQQYVEQQQQQQQRKEQAARTNKTNQDSFPIISNVVSLAPKGNQQQINIRSPASVTVTDQQSGKSVTTTTTGNQTVQQQIIIQPPPPKSVKNKAMWCKPLVQTKATACRPHTQTKEIQTEGKAQPDKVFVPVPVPIYCPTPLSMYTVPTPVLVPVPVPVPVPVFIPTTRKSSASILKQIKEIQEKIPADPLEAELLMMAEAVAGKGEDSSSDSDEGETEAPATKEVPPASTGGELGEDMLQMALRMASEMSDEPVMDLETSLEPVAVNTDPPPPPLPIEKEVEPEDDEEYVPTTRSKRGRGSAKRSSRTTPRRNPKRQKTETPPRPQYREATPSPPPVQAPPPDANFHLKYTYGVNAFKHWVTQKNAQLEQAMKPGNTRQLKTFKTDILQCTADELNYALCLFVKEVRKPNGEEYAVDSIYYLCLGIQQYLFENGRIDNVFTDMYYERFTECLNELLCRYEPKLNQAGQLVCRIEEEHLWESKQLGAHSPHVLLNTLVYFNTKYFMLKTSEDHLKLSFTHIMKHWKKTASGRGSGVGVNQGRSVYLRYYCPTPQTKENSQKKKKEEMPVYEQTENLDNPLRCPVKLYEFYLSKCPESIKNRNDTFYLIPERSCVPDSPVWYSTTMLGIDAMAKMLNRIRLVREIQEAHLHTQPIYI